MNSVEVAANWNQTDGLRESGVAQPHSLDFKLIDADICTLMSGIISPVPSFDFFEKSPLLASQFFTPPYSELIISRYEITEKIPSIFAPVIAPVW